MASLLLQNGTTTFSGTIQAGPAVTVGGGATLKSSGTLDRSVTLMGGYLVGPMTINGNLTSTGGSISPGSGGGATGTLSVVGNVTLDQGTTLNYQLSAPNVSGGSGNDLIDITGNLSLDGTVQVIGLSGFGAGAYTLFDYSGLLSGAGLTIGASMPGGGYNYRLLSGGGQINLVASLWALGDVNHDGAIDSHDLDAIYAHFGNVTANLSLAQYDVDGDNAVSQADVTYELSNILHCTYGDADLDGKVDFIDFQTLLSHWQMPGAGWADGDFNGDGTVDFLDFQILLAYWNPGGTGSASQTVAPATRTMAAATAAVSSPATSPAVSASTDAPVVENASPVLSPATQSDVSQTADQTSTTDNGSSPHRTQAADIGYLWDDGPVDLLTHFQKPILTWSAPSPH
jgi:hypothetical protein